MQRRQVQHEEIDRILTRSMGWMGDLNGLLRIDREKMRVRVRALIARQFNGEVWDAEVRRK